MVEAIIKLLAGQVLTSRPALERPITHAKYGLLGALAAGLVGAVATLALGGALYLWLISVGASQALSLLLLGVVLLLAAAIIWRVIRAMMERELQYQQIKAELEAQSKAPAAGADLVVMLSSLLQETAKSFAEGLSAPRKEENTDPGDTTPAE
ncbi:hypothetical protein [Kordiimonas aestuarii]|uniref:hypothetical protein n=1 Tax=Kordiimonas aestuarii TaxID=1005925 RepID=UPI0021CF0E17|nr:hypothetical protein [Kordiimonas aestuarii]